MIAVFMGMLAIACANKNVPAPVTPMDLNGHRQAASRGWQARGSGRRTSGPPK
jgi:hypothetical protein